MAYSNFLMERVGASGLILDREQMWGGKEKDMRNFGLFPKMTEIEGYSNLRIFM